MLMKFTDKTKEERCSLKEEKERERDSFPNIKEGTHFKKKNVRARGDSDEDGRAEAITVKQTGCCLCTTAPRLPSDTCQR